MCREGIFPYGNSIGFPSPHSIRWDNTEEPFRFPHARQAVVLLRGTKIKTTTIVVFIFVPREGIEPPLTA